jgi:hypothetical protein
MKSILTEKRYYLVEGGVNFFEELLKQTSITPVTSLKEEVEKCLITDAPLTEYFVELYCGHKFNYLPLYAEVKYQKLNRHCLEVSRLTAHEIKCPYCRKIQKSLLPYHESLDHDAPKIYGVNSIVVTPPTNVSKQVLKKPAPAKCVQILKTGINKGAPCCARVSKNGLCMRHYKMINNKIKEATPVEVHPILEALAI